MKNQPYYNNWFMHRVIKVSRRIVDFIDSFTDKKICGISLTRFVPSIIAGATGSQATPYLVLETMFNHSSFLESDSFIDVGCGKGRVLAYMIKNHSMSRIDGVELCEDEAHFAQKWTGKYPNVNVICGNAFDLNYNNYSVIYMGRPFLDNEIFYKFIGYLESTLTHPISLYFWVEQYTGDFLNKRAGWKLKTRKSILFVKGLFVTITPQRYSIWRYTPLDDD